MAEYLHLNIEPELLDSLAADYHPTAHSAAGDLLERLQKRPLQPDTADQANHRIQLQDWLVVISSTLWELRTSLVYAEAHFDRHIERSNQSDMIPTDSSLAFDYFIENATIRAHSVVEKTLQLLNVVCRLGLAEVGKVRLDNVRKELTDPEYVDSINRLHAVLDLVEQMRHAHVHRFDPGIVRSEVVEAVVQGVEPSYTVNLYRMRERPISAAEQLSRCKQAYRGLDNELAALFRVMSSKAREW